MTSGSNISSSVGSAEIYGCSATMLVPSGSVCLVFVIVSILLFLGAISMSDPLVESYLYMAMFLVWTIFQVCRDEVLKI